jgi:hypothetical protein
MTIEEAIMGAAAEIAKDQPGFTFSPFPAGHAIDGSHVTLRLGAVPRTVLGVRTFFLDNLAKLYPAMVYQFDGDEAIVLGAAPTS